MSKRFITYGSIDQFRTIIKNVQHQARYKEWDEVNQVPIYDSSIKMPKITCTGSEKIHGTNAGFSYNEIDKEWYQSRKNIITPEKDNAACAFFMEDRKELLINVVKNLANSNNINLDKQGIVIFGEWAGGNIQKKSALSGLDKRFIIFQYAKVYNIVQELDDKGEEISNYWIKVDTILP